MIEEKKEIERVPVPFTQRGIAIADTDALIRFSELVVRGVPRLPDHLKSAANIAVAIETGREIGLPPMASLFNIIPINGKPTVMGDAALALVRQSGQLVWKSVQWKGEFPNNDFTCIFTSLRKGDPEPQSSPFSISDAKTAQLWDKQGPWKMYPKRMLYYRALGANLRDNFSDILLGVHIMEEMDNDSRIEADYEIRETPIAHEQPEEENDLAFIIRAIGGNATLAILRIHKILGADLQNPKAQIKLKVFAQQIKEGANANDLFPAPKDELPEFDATPKPTEPEDAPPCEGEEEASPEPEPEPEPSPPVKKTRAKSEKKNDKTDITAAAPDPETPDPKEVFMSLLEKAAAKFPGLDQSEILGVITKGEFANLEFSTPEDFKKCFALVHDWCVTKKIIPA